MGATPQTGLAPLKVSFKVCLAAGISVQRIEADFDGNGAVDFTTTNPNDPIEFTDAQPGVYYPMRFVTDSQGNATTRVIPTVVQDTSALD